jgi:hypothetical protein
LLSKLVCAFFLLPRAATCARTGCWCADGLYKDLVADAACTSCAADTVSLAPRANRTACACAAGFEPGQQDGPDVLGGSCVAELLLQDQVQSCLRDQAPQMQIPPPGFCVCVCLLLQDRRPELQLISSLVQMNLMRKGIFS